MGRVCGTHGRKLHTVLLGMAEVKRSLGRPRRRWENNIKIDLREMEWGVE
jgi:hypothetical protein